jgi:hypothetical protein
MRSAGMCCVSDCVRCAGVCDVWWVAVGVRVGISACLCT